MVLATKPEFFNESSGFCYVSMFNFTPLPLFFSRLFIKKAVIRLSYDD